MGSPCFGGKSQSRWKATALLSLQSLPINSKLGWLCSGSGDTLVFGFKRKFQANPVARYQAPKGPMCSAKTSPQCPEPDEVRPAGLRKAPIQGLGILGK